MRFSSAAIFTLAALAANNLNGQATAATDSTPSEDKKAENFVVPVLEDNPASTKIIPQPETLAVNQFSSVTEQLTVNSQQLPVNSNQLSVNSVSDSVSQRDMQLPVKSKGVQPKNQENKKQTQIVIKTSPNSPAPPLSPSPSPPLPPSQIPVKTKNDFVVPATSVRIVGVSPELQQIIGSVIKTQPGGETSQTQLKQDVTAILETG
ncbi:MAG: outer membrane protein assembly factor, partial [Cyanobacteriota bacterium]|nr:outer membrane protein assembly factor [Cyanobacteriota bacterium]